MGGPEDPLDFKLCQNAGKYRNILSQVSFLIAGFPRSFCLARCCTPFKIFVDRNLVPTLPISEGRFSRIIDLEEHR